MAKFYTFRCIKMQKYRSTLDTKRFFGIHILKKCPKIKPYLRLCQNFGKSYTFSWINKHILYQNCISYTIPRLYTILRLYTVVRLHTILILYTVLELYAIPILYTIIITRCRWVIIRACLTRSKNRAKNAENGKKVIHKKLSTGCWIIHSFVV